LSGGVEDAVVDGRLPDLILCSDPGISLEIGIGLDEHACASRIDAGFSVVQSG